MVNKADFTSCTSKKVLLAVDNYCLGDLSRCVIISYALHAISQPPTLIRSSGGITLIHISPTGVTNDEYSDPPYLVIFPLKFLWPTDPSFTTRLFMVID